MASLTYASGCNILLRIVEPRADRVLEANSRRGSGAHTASRDGAPARPPGDGACQELVLWHSDGGPHGERQDIPHEEDPHHTAVERSFFTVASSASVEEFAPDPQLIVG